MTHLQQMIFRSRTGHLRMQKASKLLAALLGQLTVLPKSPS